MNRILFLQIFFLFSLGDAGSQTYSWSGYPAGTSSYTNGIMQTTITASNTARQYGSPQYYAGTAVGSGMCGIANGLAIEEFFGNITNANETMVMDFTSGGTTNGTCASMQFQIEDINSDESVQTFADKVTISAIDGNNAAVAVGNIVITLAAGISVANVGSTRVISGYSGSYGSRSTGTCGVTTITVTPPVGVTLKSITLKYWPDYTVCASCYYNWTGPLRPAYQYISIGPLVATPTGGGCTVLPVVLVSFSGKCNNNVRTFEWATASETNNDYFTIEKSMDGKEFSELGKINGAGNSSVQKKYSAEFPDNDMNHTYYRLKQTDFDGRFSYSNSIHVNCLQNYFDGISLFPNPAIDEINIHFETAVDSEVKYEITDVFGKAVKQGFMTPTGKNFPLEIGQLSAGVYFIKLKHAEGSVIFPALRFVKQ